MQSKWAIPPISTKVVNSNVHVLCLINPNSQIDACFTSPYLWMELFKAGDVSSLPDNLGTTAWQCPRDQNIFEKLDAVTANNTRILYLWMTEVGGIAFIEATDKLQWKEQGDLVGEVFESISVDITTSSKESSIGEIIDTVHLSTQDISDILHDKKKKVYPQATSLGRFQWKTDVGIRR